jgi:hypothetical protein
MAVGIVGSELYAFLASFAAFGSEIANISYF